MVLDPFRNVGRYPRPPGLSHGAFGRFGDRGCRRFLPGGCWCHSVGDSGPRIGGNIDSTNRFLRRARRTDCLLSVGIHFGEFCRMTGFSVARNFLVFLDVGRFGDRFPGVLVGSIRNAP